MNAWGWVAMGLLAAVVLWLAFALAGAVRELAALRGRVEALEDETGPVHLADGLPVGAAAPSWQLASRDGAAVSSSAMRGKRHLVLFADAECRACDALVPEVIEAAASDRLVPVAIVGRGTASATPAAWVPVDGRVIVGVEQGVEVSEAFRTEVSPHAFVVDEGGFVAAQGGPLTLDDVRALIADADGLRIVTGAADG
ncbi:MAG TPA: hypothetical protein VNG34_10450 [Actinomycetota bacterium]|nr:hypothetical protein [Actinomycetota bacterium]